MVPFTASGKPKMVMVPRGVSPSELRSKDSCRKAGEWGRFQAWSTWTDPHWPGSQLWSPSVWGDVYLLQYWENQDNTLPPQEWWHSWVDEPYITGYAGQVHLWVPAWLGCSPAFGYDGIQVQCPLIDSIYATLSFVWSRGTTTLRYHVWSQAILARSSLGIC